jgi:hypothetical protein
MLQARVRGGGYTRVGGMHPGTLRGLGAPPSESAQAAASISVALDGGDINRAAAILGQFGFFERAFVIAEAQKLGVNADKLQQAISLSTSMTSEQLEALAEKTGVAPRKSLYAILRAWALDHKILLSASALGVGLWWYQKRVTVKAGRKR